MTMVRFQQMAKYGRAPALNSAALDVVRFR